MQNVVIYKNCFEGTLRQGFVCLRPSTLYPLSPYTLLYVYTINLFTQERGESWTREKGGGGNSSQRGVENTNMTDCISSL